MLTAYNMVGKPEKITDKEGTTTDAVPTEEMERYLYLNHQKLMKNTVKSFIHRKKV
jgi:hypothetical protein